METNGSEDTICAIATPVGEGGIGIVRLSGAGAVLVAEKITRLRSGCPLRSVSSHRLVLADIVWPALPPHNDSRSTTIEHLDQVIDEGLVVYMKAPRSFTAEDVVELHCHGNGVILGRVCEACLAAGARMAQPGEFTKRAFLNGRLDLSQAEAVLDTIKAKSDGSLKVAQRHLRGDLRYQVDQLRGGLLSMLAHVEAGIDFVEEDISFIGRDDLIGSLGQALWEIQRMVSTAEHGRVLRDGARVVIIGSPNVGKSSLLNSFLREERAIVTPIPGTTRDVIEESVVWDGQFITLVDTAGMRETVDVVEQEGIRRTISAQQDADIILSVWDVSELNEEQACELAQVSDAAHEIVLLNKMDLIDEGACERLVSLIRRQKTCAVLPISVRTGVGIESVRKAIKSHLAHDSLESDEGIVVTSVRHRSALERSAASLRQALSSAEAGSEPEFIAVDLREAANALGEITGAITTDEILERVFSEFCIGK